MKQNSSKKLAKLFAMFLSCATLLVPVNVLSSCKQPTTPSQSQQQTPAEETLPLKEGMIDWNKFLQVARTGDGMTYTFKNFSNSDDLKGFTGIAVYQDLLSVLQNSIYGSRMYDTTGLKVFFKDTEITPTIIETLLNKISKLNISNTNAKGEIAPVKITSGAVATPDIFDVDNYDNYLKSGKITITDNAEVQKSGETLLLGTKNTDEQDTKITDQNKVLYLLNSKLFKSAKLHKLNFDGNLFEVMKILNKEATPNNIKFTPNSFFKAKLQNENLDLETIKNLYEIQIEYIKEMKSRGSNVNLENLQIKGLGFGTATGFDLNNSSFKNVYFTNYNDLTAIDLNNTTMKGLVVMSGKLPSKMEYANIDGKLVLDNANSTLPNGTLLTGSYIKALEIKNLAGIENLKIADDNKGQIDGLKGKKSHYDELIKIFNIDKYNLNLMLGYIHNMQKVYG